MQAEEEEYTTRVIHYFSSGLITLPEGKTLRSYLAEKLQCDPMRITKKYAGAACLGKRIHHLCESPKFTPQEIQMAKMEIERLEERFRTRLVLGAGANLPPLHPVPVIHGSTLSTANYEDSTASYGSQPQPAPESFQPSLGNAIGSNEQSHAMPSESNNSMVALIQSLTGNPQLASSLSNNLNVSGLMNALTQQTAPPPVPQVPHVPTSLNPTLQQILQQANIPMPPSVASQQQVSASVQNQDYQLPSSVAGSQPQQLLLKSNQNFTAASAPQPFAPSNGLNNASNNDKLAQALLAQITAQLQTLASISPATFQKVQSQLMSASVSSNTSPWNQAGSNSNDQSSLLKNIQQLSNPQAPSQGMAFGQQYQQGSNQINDFQHLVSQQQPSQSFQSILQALSAQQQQKPPTESAATRNLKSLIAAQKSAAANASTNAPLANSYNEFMSNLAAASENANRSNAFNSLGTAQTTNQAPVQNSSSSSATQSQQSRIGVLTDLIKGQNPSITAENMSGLIDALRNGHFGALSNVQSTSIKQGKLGDMPLELPEENGAASAGTGKLSGVGFHSFDDSANVSSEGTNSDYTKSDEGYDCNEERGRLKKKMKSSANGISTDDLASHNERMKQAQV